MTKTEDSIHVLKTASCKTLSGKSTLTYQIGCTPDSEIHLRISKNTGAGFFSDEWIALDDILNTLDGRPEGSPVLSHFLTPLLKGKSVNTSAFILAALSHLKLVRPTPGKKRHHELLDPGPVLDRLASTAKAKTVRKTATKTTSTSTNKTAVRKKAASRRKSA